MYEPIQQNPHLGDLTSVVEENLKLVHYVCQKNLKKGANLNISYEDLYGWGCMGLLKAYRAYKDGHNTKFSTYAVASIDGEIRRWMRDWEQGAHWPRRVRLNFYKIMGQQLHESPAEEIAQKLGMPMQEILEALDYGEHGRPHSLDERVEANFKDGDNPCLVDVLPQYDDETVIYINEFYRTLSPREAEIVQMYFVSGWGQQEVADYFNLSQGHVSRLIKSIKKKAQRFFEVS